MYSCIAAANREYAEIRKIYKTQFRPTVANTVVCSNSCITRTIGHQPDGKTRLPLYKWPRRYLFCFRSRFSHPQFLNSFQNTTRKQHQWLLLKRNPWLLPPPNSPIKVCNTLEFVIIYTNSEMIQAAIVSLKERAGSS